MYAGLRPLLSGESEASSKLSREHAVSQAVSGLISVAGGKYTTYRVMAKDAVDVAARAVPHARPPVVHGSRFRSSAPPATPASSTAARRSRATRGSGSSGCEHLLERYGTRTTELIDSIRERPDLGAPLEGAEDYLRAEAIYAASHEGALHLDDVLTRRTRISIETFDRGLRAAPEVARLMGEVLGWDETTIARELHHYEARVKAERESQEQPDDHTADAARLGAPDVRMGDGAGLGWLVELLGVGC